MSTAYTNSVTVDILFLARVAGLSEVVDLFPDEVIAAARSAAQARAAMQGAEICKIEPWPSMRVFSQE